MPTINTYFDTVTNTTYYIVKMPYIDENGNVNKIKRGFAYDNPNSGILETVRSFATRHNASLTINASIFGSDNKFQGMQIQDGIVLNTLPTRVDRHILGIKDDGTLKSYPSTTSSATIIADGCNTALTSFIPIMDNGVKVSQSIFDSYAASTWAYRRQVIAQMPNKDYLILSCEADTLGNVGLNLDDCVRILSTYGVRFAFLLDGGGSVQTVVRGVNIVSLKDDDGHTERGVPDMIYWAKDIPSDEDKANSLISGDIGEVYNKVKQLEVDLYNLTNKLNSLGTFGNVQDKSSVVTDLDTVTKQGWVWATPSTLHSPNATYSWGVETIALNSTALLQIATRFSSPFEVKKRRLNGTTWSAWE